MSELENNIEDLADLSEDDSSVIKELRQQLKDLKSENAAYKPLVQEKVFKEAGVDVTSPFGKAVSKLYKGPLEATALREFVAEEFGEQPDVPQQEQPIVEAQRQVNQVMSMSGSKQPVDAMDAFTEVIQAGNVHDSIKAKLYMIDEKNKQDNK